ncbi:hypothetical protein HJB67_12995 [Rhizobium lentis]|uniref:hypothetical protein n=1 Tax=Rhizobium lentis TaxID=1138194 RepID=UPI001C83BD62|nr:hypothetical protein [Rhizobium lentis]MBX5010872.1 hypothetical protein [Rhizobium lentis]
MTANEIVGAANNKYFSDLDAESLSHSYFLAAKWHDKQAGYCDDVAKDDPRVDAAVRERAAMAAKHHRGSAAGLRLAATDLLRANRPTAAP